eukprot:6417362-Ditylum_brightwellii.AAC.2
MEQRMWHEKKYRRTWQQGSVTPRCFGCTCHVLYYMACNHGCISSLGQCNPVNHRSAQMAW